MKTHLLAIAGIALLALGFLGAWEIYKPRPAKPEPPAAAIRQKDGSLELQRAATETPGALGSVKPAQVIPKGAKVERIVQVTVDTNAKSDGDAGRGTSAAPAGSLNVGQKLNLGALSRPDGSQATQSGKVTVNLSLVRMPDKTQRVIASSPQGEVVGGLDIPVAEPTFPKIQRWTASGLAGYDSRVARNVFGGEVSFSKGPFVISGGVIGGTAFAGAGIKF